MLQNCNHYTNSGSLTTDVKNICSRGWHGVVGTVTCLLRAKQQCYGLSPGRGRRHFSSTQRPHNLWGPLSVLCNGYDEGGRGGSCSRGALAVIKLHHSPPSSAEVTKEWAYAITVCTGTSPSYHLLTIPTWPTHSLVCILTSS